MKNNHEKSLMAIIGFIAGIAAVVATVTTLIVYNKKKREEEELENYLDNSIL